MTNKEIIHQKCIEANPEIECEKCNGTGAEICDNPDHGLIDALTGVRTGHAGDVGRIGCPVCGHDDEHKVPNSTCEACDGRGNRTIYFGDVLLALGKKKKYCIKTNLRECQEEKDTLRIGYDDHADEDSSVKWCSWNLRKEDLDKQSEETINWLAEILK